jgi:N-acetylglucosaminyldiphosphoundecaprenol N-acetyl-beta-D-mannosaminyltransferase
MAQALVQMVCWIDNDQRDYVVVCPVHSVMVGQSDPGYRAIVNRAGMVTPDGMPLVFLSRRMGYHDVERVYGPDLMLAFSELAAERGFRNYYYGGAEGVPETLAEALTARFPGLEVVGTYSPPFRDLTEEEDQAIIDAINEAKPDIVWIGLGSPKQDAWMAEHRARLNAPVLIGVGAAFDFLSGRKRQAPRWMQRNGLEWFYRLVHEPRRLWRRYLINNSLFIYFMLLQLIGLRRVPLTDAHKIG